MYIVFYFSDQHKSPHSVNFPKTYAPQKQHSQQGLFNEIIKEYEQPPIHQWVQHEILSLGILQNP